MSVMSNVLDTLRMDVDGIYLKDLHAARTHNALGLMGPKLKLDDVKNIYNEIESQLLKASPTSPKIVRLVINQNLKYSFELKPLHAIKEPIHLQMFHSQQVCGEGRQNFKWEDRIFWERLLLQKGTAADDIISVNTENQVTETSRFNLFLFSKSDEAVYTPKLSSGCVDGVLRRHLLNQGSILLPDLGSKTMEEKNISANDLFEYSIYVGNSVRGVLSAILK